MTHKYTRYLVFDSSGKGRVVSTLRSLSYNEIAYKLNVTVPPSWGMIAGEINIELPSQEGDVSLEPEPIKPAIDGDDE